MTKRTGLPVHASLRGRVALRWRIVAALLIASLLPLALLGIGSWIVFGRLAMDKTVELQRTMVQSHASAIDLYLGERRRALETISRTHPVEQLTRPGELQRIFEGLSESYPGAFVDLGVIDAHGRHLAYVGPYDLKQKNYASSAWFSTVMAQGAYVSDVFLGYRGVPHFVVAVRRQRGQKAWVLRATLNSETFNSIVRLARLGDTGDAFLVDLRGRYQTPPKEGRVLDMSSVVAPRPHRGIRASRATVQGRPALRVTTWLRDSQQMLVVQQDEAEIRAPVHRAIAWGALVLALAVVLVVATTFFATWHLTNRIDRATGERDRLNQDLLRSAKLASVGELATGLAHEINNPLAIIMVEQTNLRDELEELGLDEEPRGQLIASVERCQRQVARCGNITRHLLDFGRKTDSSVTLLDIQPTLADSVELMRRPTGVRNIELALDVDGDLPRVMGNATELEQVLINLISNAMHAIDGAGEIRVSAKRNGKEVLVGVHDTGSGIAPADLTRIFEPFFTTKPPGQGTGLGLSVCYGVVRRWGGRIVARSEVGRGTQMTIHLPMPAGAER